MSPLHTLRLTTPGISGMGTEVYLDGVLVKGTTHVLLEIGMENANRLTLTLLVDGINAEAVVEMEEEPDAMDPGHRETVASGE